MQSLDSIYHIILWTTDNDVYNARRLHLYNYVHGLVRFTIMGVCVNHTECLLHSIH